MSLVVKSEIEIKKNLVILAAQINNDYKHIDMLDIICFINGASIFCSDLIRLLKVPIRLHHFGFSPYDGAPVSGDVKIEFDLKESIEQRHVLLLEGLIISGRTPRYLMNFFKSRNPASLKLCAIGIKQDQFQVDLSVDFYMFVFGDEWVEGYGIGGSRNKCLPYLIDSRVLGDAI